LPTTKETAARVKSYADLPLTREDYVSILECNPHDIRHIPSRYIDNGLVVMALRLGARADEIPAF
jgi:hypothetical protein